VIKRLKWGLNEKKPQNKNGKGATNILKQQPFSNHGRRN
jgi:hypothetical protein